MAKFKIDEFEEGDLASRGVRWQKWTALLEDNCDWFGVTEAEKKVKALRIYGGERVRDLVDSLPEPEIEGDVFDKTMAKLNAFFLPKKNTDVLVARFRKMRQNDHETIMQYYARLRPEAAKCEFHDTELEIKRHLQETVRNRRFAKKSVRDRYSLEKLLEEAQADEEANANELEMTAKETQDAGKQDSDANVNRVKARKDSNRNANRSHRKVDGKAQEESRCRKKGGKRTCGRCGLKHEPKKCPAFGKTCSKCLKKNHFARACRSDKVLTEKVNQVGDSSDEEDSDDEYVKKITIGWMSAADTGKKTTVKFLLNGVKVQMAIDSGASANIMDEGRFQKIQERSKERLRLEKSKVKLYGYASEVSIPVAGKFNALVETDKKAVPATFIVVKGKTKGEMLLGCDTAMELGVLKIVNSVDNEGKELRPVVADIVSEYDCLFHGIGKHKHAKVKIRVDESVTPVAQVNRRIPYHYQDKLKEQLQKLEEAGVVESVPDDEPTTWISPLVIQPKKAVGEIRICVDMRKPNEAMLREKREFPTVEDILQELNGAVKFSKLDLNHGYHQLELDVGSRHLTTFSTPWGLKRYTRLNFGTVVAQEVFHEEVKKTIAGVQGAKNITDDIIVYGKTPELHDQALKDTLQKLKLNGLTLNRAKCLFDQSRIEFFGYVLSAEGISPDPAKVQALREAGRPSNAEEVRSFLGMANYSARFIKNFSTIAAPLRELTRSKVEWRWRKREQEAFMKIKNSLLDSATLAYYEVGADTEVVVDASPVGLGAVLTQKKRDGHRPVTYISRSLSPVEQRYSQTEREALAIHWACERLRMYLAGAQFKVVTDHKPLEAIFNNSNSKPPVRIERWSMYLQEFDFTVEYRPGKGNPADYMSRHPVRAPENTTDYKEQKQTEEVVNSVVRRNVPESLSVEEVRKATMNDFVLLEVMDIVQNGNGESGYKSEDLRPYKLVRSELSVANGILLRGSRIVVPKALQRRVVNISHEGHQGIVKTKQLLRSAVWFPGIDRMTEDVVRSCLPCQAATQQKPKEPLRMTELPERPWQKISLDFSGPYPSGEYCLIVVDDYSRYPVVELVSTTSAAAVIPRLDKIFSMFGIPEECKSDNGPPFQSREFVEYAKTQGFRHRKITPLHPESNGEAERFVKTLQKFITTITVEGSSWKMSLPDFLRVYRSTPHTVTGRSPYSQLFGGREMRGKIPQFSLSSEEDPEVRQKDALLKRKMKIYADKRANAKPSPIREGDTVLLRQEKKNKLSTPFEGVPYTVFQKKGSMVTAERTTDGRMVTRNTEDFKSCPPSTKETTQATLADEADDAIVAAKPPSTAVAAQQTSEMPQPISVVPSLHPPSVEEPRYPRRERRKPA